MPLAQAVSLPFSQSEKTTKWWYSTIILLFVATIGIGAKLYHDHRYSSLLATAQENLLSVADLKVTALEKWMAERRGDAEVMRNSLMARSILLSPNSLESKQLASERFKVWLNVYGYAAVLVADTNSLVRLVEPEGFEFNNGDLTNHINQMLSERRSIDVDLHRDRNGKTRMWLSGQIYVNLQTNGPPDGVFISIVDPNQFLYPFISRWPTSSKTAETLIVQREGDYAVYQNQLRHTTNAAMTFKVKLDQATHLLCVKILRGDKDVEVGKVYESIDYRGKEVLSIARWIPNSQWLMVAKIDKAEIFAPLQHETYLTTIIFVLAILVLAMSMAGLSRRQKMALIKASEERFRLLIEQAPTAISISRGNNTLYANKKYLDLYGFDSLEEVINCPVTDQWSPEYRPLIAQRIKQRARGENVPNEYDGIGQRRNGASFPVQVAVAFVELTDGKASLAFLTDITDRKRAEENNFKLATIVETSDDAITSKNLDGIILSWNHGAENLFGYTSIEAIGQPMTLIFPAELISEEYRILAQIAKGETVKHFETERITKSGSRLKVSVTISPIKNAKGEITGASTIARDITKQKQSAESLRLFRMLIDNANDGIEVVDPATGRFVDVNDRTGKLHGYTREEYLALKVSEIDTEMLGTGKDAWDTQLKKLKTSGSIVFESTHRRKDGSTFPVEINATHVCLERDYILAVVRDITERKRAETQIRQLNRVYRVLSSINTLIVRERNVKRLLDAACRIAVEEGQFKMAWVGIPDEESGCIKASSSFGITGSYLAKINLTLADSSRMGGPSGKAFLSGEHQYCNDIENDPSMTPWREDAMRMGYGSSGSFPLKIEGKIFGIFTIYAAEKNFFDSQELNLLDELASDIGFGIEVNQREMERQRVARLFEMAFEQAAIGKALVSPAGRWLKVNRALCKMLGYSPGEFLANDYRSFTHPEDLKNDSIVMIQLLEGSLGSYEVEKRYRHKAGHYVWSYLTTSLVRNLDGEPDYFISQIQDISERKQAEQALRASERQFHNAFDLAAIGKAIVALDGRWLKVNKALCTMVGYNAEELTKLKFQDITHPEDLRSDVASVDQLLSGKIESYQTDKRYLHKQGHIIWVMLSVSLIRDDEGRPLHFISQVQDITERRNLEAQFRQAQKMEAFGQLAGGVAHDFNNVLAAIMMQAEVTLLDKDLPPTVSEELSQIRASAERGANLTSQLLLFSRKKVMQPQQVDLNLLLSSLAKMLRRLIGADVALQLDLKKEIPNTMADPGMIDQVVLNLIVNARDAMPQGGQINIATVEKVLTKAECDLWEGAQPGLFVGFTVTDSGTGIAPDNLTRIFEPFFTTKEAGKGTGLGLATVYGIVKQHKGTIFVQSKLGAGTTFTIMLPAVMKEALTSKVIQPSLQLKGGSETILLVEDELLVRSMTKLALERAGYRVLEAPDGIQASELWAQHHTEIKLLLTDLVMPGGVNGRELAARLKTQCPSLPVIFISGYSSDIAGRELELKTGENFIQKPCRLEPLLYLIRKSIDGCPETEFDTQA